MPGRSKSKENGARQFAAVPLREEAGRTLVMLVTSRGTGRWVLPKGWAEKQLTGAQLAEKEAYEEAGIRGVIGPRSIGAYRYTKELPRGRAIECLVEAFPLHVTEQLNDWPEAQQRRREWFTPSQAATKVAESELVTMLLSIS